LELWDEDYDKWQVSQLFTWTCTNQTTSWLVCSWNTFGAWMNHMHTRTHKTHHGPDLTKATTFSLIVLFVINHGGYMRMSFCLETPKLGILKFLKLRFFKFWKPITFCICFQLKRGLKQNCSPCWKLCGTPPTHK
jgi:hypothetical protein